MASATEAAVVAASTKAGASLADRYRAVREASLARSAPL